MVDQPLKLWGSGYRANKIQLVAAFAGVHVEQQLTFTHGTTNKTAQFLAMNDRGKVSRDLDLDIASSARLQQNLQ